MTESNESNQKMDDDVKQSNNSKKPNYSTQIHVSGYKNSFTYQLCNGKRKIDQTLQRFCVKNKCIGVFEAKIKLKEYGFKSQNVNKIKYDINNYAILLKYESIRNGFDFEIKFPSTITINAQNNPYAVYLDKIGILSCRVPIISHRLVLTQYNPNKQPKLGVLGGKKKRKWNDKINRRLHQNHKKLSENNQNLTGFQKSLYEQQNGIGNNKSPLKSRRGNY